MMCLDLISPAALPRSRFLGDRYILRYDRYSEAVFRRTVLANLRDIGGPESSFGGTVRTGIVFRSTDLASLSADGAQTLADLASSRSMICAPNPNARRHRI